MGKGGKGKGGFGKGGKGKGKPQFDEGPPDSIEVCLLLCLQFYFFKR